MSRIMEADRMVIISVIINHLKADAFTSKVRMTGKKGGVEEFINSDLIKKFFTENQEEKSYWMETFGNLLWKRVLRFWKNIRQAGNPVMMEMFL